MEIKMGTKDGGGIIPTIGTKLVHTGNLNPVTMTVSKIGMESLIKEKEIPKIKYMSINKMQCIQLLEACAQDLATKRKVQTSNGLEILELLLSFDNRSLIFSFNKDISYVNEAFKIKEKDLADFLSNFFFLNASTYCNNVFGAEPESLPIISAEALQNNRVILTIH